MTELTETARALRELKDLCARRDIYDVVCLYMRGQDRLLPEVQRQAFHDDAHVDCGLFSGPPDAYVDFAQGFLAKIESSQHIIGQVHISIDEDVADGEVYFVAWHRTSNDGVESDLLIGGRYIDRYEKRFGSWRIMKRRELIDWARTDPSADAFIKDYAATLHVGGRADKDFSVTRAWP